MRGVLLAAAALGLACATVSACMSRPIAAVEPHTTNLVVEQIQNHFVDKLDLLFMIDNSASMGDKQDVLAEAVPDLLNRLVKPVAEDESGAIVGTVQVLLNLPENQPHRGDVAKMLVHRRARRLGVGAALLAAAERAALDAGRTLLVLDTVTNTDAYRLYTRQGWQRVGEIPSYALWPDGRPCPTTIFFKSLRA